MAQTYFTVELAVSASLSYLAGKGAVAGFFFGGPIGSAISYLLTRVLSKLVTVGIIVVDVNINKAQEHMTKEEWKKFASSAYVKAQKRVYNEKEKQVIRNQYLAALRKFRPIGKLRDR